MFDEGFPIFARRRRHLEALALEQAHVAVDVADDLHLGRNARVGFDEITDGRAQTRS